jgi:class 3 adenylate cyclase
MNGSLAWPFWVAALLIAALVLGLTRMRARVRRLDRLLDAATTKLEHLQLQFARFAPSDVIEWITGSGSRLTPERRRVTVLFADLRGFTSMCDRLDPVETVDILNGYFQCMTEAITRHHGRVTELTGDGLLALFGALESDPWQAQDAALGALAMRAELVRYNGELSARDLPELRFGVGIHQGEVLAGVMGNSELSKFGVVGDPINVASRVEGLTRVHGVDVLITEEVRAALDGRFHLECMPPVQVKGKAEPIVTYYLEGLEEDYPPPDEAGGGPV